MMYCSHPVQEEQQQQHRALPHGFFCNLIFCKQERQLFWLEDWAAGTVGPKTGDWVQASREQVRCLMGVSGDCCLEFTYLRLDVAGDSAKYMAALFASL